VAVGLPYILSMGPWPHPQPCLETCDPPLVIISADMGPERVRTDFPRLAHHIIPEVPSLFQKVDPRRSFTLS
jgi:hypothetical protein